MGLRTRLFCCLALALLMMCAAEAEEECGHLNAEEIVTSADSCHGVETYVISCRDCGLVSEEYTRSIPVAHAFGEWILEKEASCTEQEKWKRVCLNCGFEETESRGELKPHVWGEPVVVQQPDCENTGLAMADCLNCEARQEIELPAQGHEPSEKVISEPTAEKDGEIEVSCTRCGKLLEMKAEPYRMMMYNNTITSFGPCTRDLIGGKEWYRITPLDLTRDGTYTYPLIATNRYTVGKMTARIDKGDLTVSYKLNSNQIRVNSETLIIYPNLEALQYPEGLDIYELNVPISIEDNFGEDNPVLLSLIIKADYDAAGVGVSWFSEDEDQISAMKDMIR